jgi:hypothetical protein
VPQLVTEPDTWYDPAERLTVAGPQILPTVMQAAFVTSVVQVADVAEAGPQGPLPVAVKKSLTRPQLVRLMVWAVIGAAVCAARLPIVMLIVSTVPLAFVIVSVTTTLLMVVEPQLVTEPETVNEPAARSIAAGPQTLVTWMQAVLPTRVTQVPDVAEADPQGPLPVAVKKSLIVPQVVRVIVCGGIGTEEWAATVPMVIGTVLTTPLALVIVSVTTTPVRSAEPQLETEPETVNEPAERSMVAGPQTLVTWIHAAFVTSVTQVPDVFEVGPHDPSAVTVKKSLLGPQLVTVMV